MKQWMLALLVFTALGNPALGADLPIKSPGLRATGDSSHSSNPEFRQKMADLHEKMASCLRSDRSVSECRKDMASNCKESWGKDGCPMMNDQVSRGMKYRSGESDASS